MLWPSGMMRGPDSRQTWEVLRWRITQGIVPGLVVRCTLSWRVRVLVHWHSCACASAESGGVMTAALIGSQTWQRRRPRPAADGRGGGGGSSGRGTRLSHTCTTMRRSHCPRSRGSAPGEHTQLPVSCVRRLPYPIMRSIPNHYESYAVLNLATSKIPNKRKSLPT